jgi:hypothetical protein
MRTFIVWFVAIVLGLGYLVYDTFQETDEDIKCRQEHGGASYVEANNFAYTSQGCRVIQLVSYTTDCLPYYTVYVTECEGRNIVTDPQANREIKEKEKKTKIEDLNEWCAKLSGM